uniref:Anti-proliferative protein domain-containing protein n=1 Tax=Mycena chlorophos TaxID=658473 RepID=A0ABQ0LFB9_MYCCL|nr:predicted protein [Mycena chlorophos]
MSSLATTVSQAVAFLTRPLLPAYPSATVAKVQLVLEANLTALYAPSWDVCQPSRGSARRCLTLSPDCLPPRAVYAACIASDVQWFAWSSLLGGRPFELIVDPGSVAIRQSGLMTWIWEQERPAGRITKTAAQILIEDDAAEDDQIFSMIADEICAPTWMTPVLAEFPDKPRSQSRCSSRSSNSSSGLSFSSISDSSHSSSVSSAVPRQSRRERARQARVYVDTSKKEVTEYDGGKTSTLSGGVMLGAKKAAPDYLPYLASSCIFQDLLCCIIFAFYFAFFSDVAISLVLGSPRVCRYSLGAFVVLLISACAAWCNNEKHLGAWCGSKLLLDKGSTRPRSPLNNLLQSLHSTSRIATRQQRPQRVKRCSNTSEAVEDKMGAHGVIRSTFVFRTGGLPAWIFQIKTHVPSASWRWEASSADSTGALNRRHGTNSSSKRCRCNDESVARGINAPLCGGFSNTHQHTTTTFMTALTLEQKKIQYSRQLYEYTEKQCNAVRSRVPLEKLPPSVRQRQAKHQGSKADEDELRTPRQEREPNKNTNKYGQTAYATESTKRGGGGKAASNAPA